MKTIFRASVKFVAATLFLAGAMAVAEEPPAPAAADASVPWGRNAESSAIDWDLTDLNLKVGDMLVYRAEARDFCDVPAKIEPLPDQEELPQRRSGHSSRLSQGSETKSR